MGIGYIAAGAVLFSEIVGGCAIRCRNFARRNSQTLTSITQNMISSNHTDPDDKGYLTRGDQWRKLLQKFRRDSNIEEENENSRKTERKKHKRSESIAQNAEAFFGSLVVRKDDLGKRESSGLSEPFPSEETERVASAASTSTSGEMHEREFQRPPTPYVRVDSSAALEEIA